LSIYETYKKHPKLCKNNSSLDLWFVHFSGIIDTSTRVDKKSKQSLWGGIGSKMNTLTVGSQFTTAKSGVSGVIQEVIQNKTGSFRVRLDVNGQDRWTTVK
jgi:hypothetical protein